MSIDPGKLYPLLDAQLETFALARQALAHNALTDTERLAVVRIRDHTMQSIRELLTILHPPAKRHPELQPEHRQ
jgi:hypothetical protein